jgi:hypothetical protein
MKLLAIDPGTTKSGWVLLENREDAAYYGLPILDTPDSKGTSYIVPVEWGWSDNHEMYSLINKFQAPIVIEDVAHYGMPVGRDVFETIRWTGRFDRHAEASALTSAYINRPEVKLALCGSPRANDSTVRQALIDRYGGEDKAVGGKKCKSCKGKGWLGRDHVVCGDCHCAVIAKGCGFVTHKGALHGISGHVWSALAVGLTYLEITNGE